MGPTMLMKLVLVICLLYIGVDSVFGKGLRLSKREAEVIKNVYTETNGRRVKKGGQNDGSLTKHAKGLSKSREHLLMYAKHMYETRNGLKNNQPQENADKPRKDQTEPLLIRSKRRNLEQPESTNHLLAGEKRLSSRDHSKNSGHHHSSHNKNMQHRNKGKGNSHNDDLKIAKEPLSDIEQKHSKLSSFKKKGEMSRRVTGKNDHKGKREDKRHHNNDHHKKIKAFKKINKKKHDDHKAEHYYKSGHIHGKAKNFNKWKNHDNKSAFHKNKSNKKHLSHKNQDLTIVKRKDIKF